MMIKDTKSGNQNLNDVVKFFFFFSVLEGGGRDSPSDDFGYLPKEMTRLYFFDRRTPLDVVRKEMGEYGLCEWD